MNTLVFSSYELRIKHVSPPGSAVSDRHAASLHNILRGWLNAGQSRHVATASKICEGSPATIQLLLEKNADLTSRSHNLRRLPNHLPRRSKCMQAQDMTRIVPGQRYHLASSKDSLLHTVGKYCQIYAFLWRKVSGHRSKEARLEFRRMHSL